MRSQQAFLLALMTCVTLLAGAGYTAFRLQRWVPHGYASKANDLIYLPSPEQTRVMSLGFWQVVADYYWVRSLQYFTEPSYREVQYKNLPDLLEVVISADPDFEYAYKFAGISTPFDVGRNRVVNVERSTSFLKRGVQKFPNNWELHFFLGFNYLNYHHQPELAAEHFALAAKIPGAPKYLSAFAAKVLTVGGDIERAVAFAQATLESTDDPEIQNLMTRRLKDLEGERIVRQIEDAAKRFQQYHGRLPFDLNELVRDGFPEPPKGFELNSEGIAQAPADYRPMVLHVPANERENRGTTP